METGLVEVQPQAVSLQVQQASDSSAIMRMVEFGMSKPDFDVDKLMKLMELKERFDASEAKRAFTEAMAQFKRNPPVIVKDASVSYKTNSGTTAYTHASIGNVVEKIVAGLAANGFSHRWVPGRTESGLMKITCVLTHKQGHSEETTLEAGSDSSGGKNNIQAVASTNTYLERYTLLMATGLATIDQPDDDGAGAGSGDNHAKPAATTQLPAMSDERFNENVQTYKNIISTGRKTPEELIATLSTKSTLTEGQKNAIKALPTSSTTKGEAK